MKNTEVKALVNNTVSAINNAHGEDGIVSSLMAWKETIATLNQELRMFALESLYDCVQHSNHWSPHYRKLCFTFIAQTRAEWKNLQPAPH
jgi:hypothetical protein